MRFQCDRISDDTINGTGNVNDERCRRVGRKNATGGGGGRGWWRVARGRRKGWHERKRKENVGERERKDSVRPGAWVEARARRAPRGWTGPEGRVPEPEPGSAGTRTDSTSTVASASAPIWRKRRVCRKSPRKWNASQPGRPPFLLHPREFLPPSPSHRNRRSSPGFPEFSSFQGTLRGWRRRRRRPEKGVAAR